MGHFVVLGSVLLVFEQQGELDLDSQRLWVVAQRLSEYFAVALLLVFELFVLSFQVEFDSEALASEQPDAFVAG